MTNIFLVSDHGFGAHHKIININKWLMEKGYLVLKKQGRSRKIHRGNIKKITDFLHFTQFFRKMKRLQWVKNASEKIAEDAISACDIDWTRIRAYCFNYANIYINLKGREPSGIVSPSMEYEKIREDIINGLLKIIDWDSGEKENVISKVWRKEEIYNGHHLDGLPDLIIEYTGGKSLLQPWFNQIE